MRLVSAKGLVEGLARFNFKALNAGFAAAKGLAASQIAWMRGTMP